jgi:hypothetical protein
MSVLCIDLESLNIKKHAAIYNHLPEVEENDKLMKTNPHSQLFINDIAEVITRYDLQDYIGVRLIHKHFRIESHQIMVEEYKEIEGIPSFVTSAQDIEDAIAMKSFPSSWIFTEEGPIIFETSTDKEVYEGVTLLLKHPEFIEEFNKLINRYQLNDIFALAVLKRQPLCQTITNNDFYLERSFDKPKYMSVVQLAQECSVNTEYAIKTSWRFKEDLKELICIFCIATRFACHGKMG